MKKKKERKFFTVGDLKKLLETIDDNLPVGVVGHFGEFIPVDQYDFREGKARLVPSRRQIY